MLVELEFSYSLKAMKLRHCIALKAESPCLHSLEVRKRFYWEMLREERRGATARWMEPREINDLTLPIQTQKPCPPGCTPATGAVGLVSVTVLYLEPELFSITYDLLLELVYVLNNFSHLYREFSLPSGLLLYHRLLLGSRLPSAIFVYL